MRAREGKKEKENARKKNERLPSERRGGGERHANLPETKRHPFYTLALSFKQDLLADGSRPSGVRREPMFPPCNAVLRGQKKGGGNVKDATGSDFFL